MTVRNEIIFLLVSHGKQAMKPVIITQFNFNIKTFIIHSYFFVYITANQGLQPYFNFILNASSVVFVTILIFLLIDNFALYCGQVGGLL